jgi:HK97 family phage prohead protease
VGHAAVFDKKSEDLGGWREVVKPGAFAKTLKDGADVRALFNHDSNYVLARTKSGTLRLAEDRSGLAVEIDPPETAWASDLIKSVERGDIDQMSFGFRAVKVMWDDTNRKEPVRELHEAQLFDVSLVTYPAYPQTSVSVREHLRSLETEPGPNPTRPEPEAPHSAEVEPVVAHHSRARKLALMDKNIREETRV